MGKADYFCAIDAFECSAAGALWLIVASISQWSPRGSAEASRNAGKNRDTLIVIYIMSNSSTNEQMAYGFLRFVFGLNICFHGVSRLLGDHQAFLAYLNKSMAPAVLVPKAAIPVFAAVLPWVEATTGLLLLLGLFTRIALIAGSIVMIALMAGITLAQQWDVAGLQLIYCLIYFVLLTYLDRNHFSLDTLLRGSPGNRSA